MKCCPLKCKGQMGREFHISYSEHIREIRNNTSIKRYSSHILNTGHGFGTITDTTDTTDKEERKYLHILVKYHIYKICKHELQMDDTNTDVHNPII
jgi:hypothetical protein